ncbi:MAG TPA: DNA internalization-related competence protein ComEC/Rec2, partial [Nakamurella sp.]|nr:DNA internalization-related competence protein ComEC/Rec2 [Nakamurella sp.]
MTRRWSEEESPPPVDLRLALPAIAVWVGCLIGLSGVRIASWVAVLTLIVTLCACVAHLARAHLTGPGLLRAPRTLLLPGERRRPTAAGTGPPGSGIAVRWACGVVAAVACLTAGVVISALHSSQRANDPLLSAAENRSWSSLSVTVDGFPTRVSSGFAAPDNGSGSGSGQSATRWRVPVTVLQAQVAGERWTSTSTAIVFGQGDEWGTVTPGERLRVSGRLGQDAIGSAPSPTIAARSPPEVVGAAPWWSQWAHTIRNALSDNASRLDGDAAGLLPGLVVGDTSGISDQLNADAKATGIAHLLAVSGSHFAVLCGITVVLLRRIGPRYAAVGGTVTLVGLVVLVGPQPSVLRAAVMGGIALLALLTGRTRSCVPALATAVILLLFVDPQLAVSAGFALSVLATGGLILLAPAWSSALQRSGVPRGWADLLVVPIAAQVVTMPIIVGISGSVSVVGVLANLIVAPVVAPALIVGVLCALTGPWWPGAAAVSAQACAPMLGWIAGVAHALARWPAATVPWPATPVGVLTLVGLSIAMLYLLRHRRFRAVLATAVAAGVSVLVPYQIVSPGWPAAGWLLTACEVGQGDAMVLSTGEPGGAVVVDTGPDPGLVDGCLDRLGVATIPLLVLTHLHADHVDGLSGVLEGRSVGAIAVGPGREPDGEWAAVTRSAAVRGITVVQPPVGFRWATGDLTLTVLGPSKTFHGTDSDPNNGSVVIMAERSGKRILMTGDVEPEAQQALLNSGVDLAADVLKVPHHGSAKILDRFLEAVSPAVAVIGVGAGNDYGHPSPRLLDALARHGVGT